MAFEVVQIIFLFFPTGPNPNAEYFNWTVVVFLGTILWALVYYHLWGKKVYVAPVAYVRKTD